MKHWIHPLRKIGGCLLIIIGIIGLILPIIPGIPLIIFGSTLLGYHHIKHHAKKLSTIIASNARCTNAKNKKN